jgi:uncharacterized protein (TIGR03437 family)
VVWNDSTTNSPAAGGGGASAFFLKPSWQTGAGVPNDGARDVPDISLAASAGHNGYMVYTGGVLSVFGGTSAGTPVFAGMVALLNQYLARTPGAAPGSGNVNPRLYALAQAVPSVFHDVTTGHNRVTITCRTATRNCTEGSFGYDAGPGFDLASGLGSVDAEKLITSWNGVAGSLVRSAAALTLTSSALSLAPGGSITLTAAVSSANGGIPVGTVTFRVGTTTLGTVSLSPGVGRSTAVWSLTGADLVSGSNAVSAEYGGDLSYTSATASIAVSVTQVSSGPPVISSFANAASFRTNFAPGMLLSIFGTNLAPAAWSATRVPLPTQLAGVSVTVNGVIAPLLYVSPTQLNIQVPYEVLTGSATVVVNNNKSTGSGSFTESAVAPGVFVDANFAPVPNVTATRGQIVTLFVTGAGAVSPAIASGRAPAASSAVRDLPRPIEPMSVTVGGLPAAIQFAGIPPGLVGVVQVNYQVPDAAPLGTNAVVVQVGSARSASANLTVTQ